MNRNSGLPKSGGPRPVSTIPSKPCKKACLLQNHFQQVLIRHLTLHWDTIFSKLREYKGKLLYYKLQLLVSLRLRFDFQAMIKTWDSSKILAKKLQLITSSRLRLYMMIIEETHSESIPCNYSEVAYGETVKSFSRMVRLILHSRLRLHFQVFTESPLKRPTGDDSFSQSKNPVFASGHSAQYESSGQDVVSVEDLKSSLVVCEGCYSDLIQRLICDLRKEHNLESDVITRTLGKKSHPSAQTQ